MTRNRIFHFGNSHQCYNSVIKTTVFKQFGGTFDAIHNLGGTKSTCGGLVVIESMANFAQFLLNFTSDEKCFGAIVTAACLPILCVLTSLQQKSTASVNTKYWKINKLY